MNLWRKMKSISFKQEIGEKESQMLSQGLFFKCKRIFCFLTIKIIMKTETIKEYSKRQVFFLKEIFMELNQS